MKFNRMFLVGCLTLVGFAVFFGCFMQLDKPKERGGSETDYTEIGVEIGTVRFNLPKEYSSFFYVHNRKAARGKLLLKSIENSDLNKIKVRHFQRVKKMSLNFHTIGGFNDHYPDQLPHGLEYLHIYSKPHHQSYSNYPQADAKTVGVQHYSCGLQSKRCRIFMKHSSLPLYFELRLKTTEEFLGAKNLAWYTKDEWSGVVEHVDQFIASFAISKGG